MTIDTNATVGELVVSRPAWGRVFESLGIDYCCGGKIPLSQACAAKKLDPQTVVRVLEAASQTPESSDGDDACTAMELAELADHVENTHHAYLKNELPRTRQLVQRVAQVHGDRHPHLYELLDTYLGFEQEMFQHMAKEEQVLFPMVRELATAEAPPQFHCGSLANPIRMMEHEHDDAGGAMEKMRELTNGYEPPVDACNTYRVMLDSLHTIEQDTHRHVHKENNILFPRALAREQLLQAAVRA